MPPNDNSNRIYLSPPFIEKEEMAEVQKAMESGWIAPVGPAIDAFELAFSENLHDREVVALNSGTSALHLALRLAGIEADDQVLVGSFTFTACANVVRYQHAIPIFMDSENDSWNLNPELIEKYLLKCVKKPKALIVTHLYGTPAAIERIVQIAEEYGVIVIEDAAEALGTEVNGRQVGTFGDYGIFSFNGNKIITTSGGGALVCKQEEKSRAIHLATQANSGRFGYDHNEVGYNYRMSNVLAAMGLAQLKKLDVFLDRKRQLFKRYEQALNSYLTFMSEVNDSRSNRWLTTGLVNDPSIDVVDLIRFLEGRNIESRRLWKPLHLHQAHKDFEFIGEGICQSIYEKGICLPSGVGMTKDQQEYVIKSVIDFFQS